MKKINLKRLSTILSEKELKNVLGGSGNGSCRLHCYPDAKGQDVSDCLRSTVEAACDGPVGPGTTCSGSIACYPG